MSETSGKITPRKAIVEPIVHPSKLNPTLQITMFQLNGNFMEWSQFVQIVMKSKRKMKYILRTSPPPSINDPKYEHWEAKNSMVMFWLLHVM